MSKNKPLIFSTKSSKYLAKSIAPHINGEFFDTKRKRFSDGEQYYKLQIQHQRMIANTDVVIVGSTHSDEALLELYRVAYTLIRLGTKRTTIIIPFLGYSTMERADKPGEIVTAKTNAYLLSTLPNTQNISIILLDLHEQSLLHYFEGGLRITELSTVDILAQQIQQLELKKAVVGSTDLGAPIQVKKLANLLSTNIILVSKARDFLNTNVLAIAGNTKGKTVIIYDDMVRSGQSLINAAHAYKKQGAIKIYAVVSHLALNNASVVKDIEASNITTLYTTNSHPMSQHKKVRNSSKIVVEDVSAIIANASPVN